jgi:hypothetical protein
MIRKIKSFVLGVWSRVKGFFLGIKNIPSRIKKHFADKKTARQNRTHEQKRALLFRGILCSVLLTLCFVIAPNFWTVNAAIFAKFPHIKDAFVWSKLFTSTESITDGAGNVVEPYFKNGLPTWQWFKIHLVNIDWWGLFNNIMIWTSVLLPLVVSLILIIHEIKYRKVSGPSETIPYKIYKKVANPLHAFWKDKGKPGIKSFWEWMKSEKRTFAAFGLLLFFMLGWGMNCILFVSTWFYQYFHYSVITIQTGDPSAMSDNFTGDQFKAIFYILLYFVAKIPFWAWILIIIGIYICIAFLAGYRGLKIRDEQMVSLVASVSVGCSVSGATGTGKTRLLHGLGDATQRYSRENLEEWAIQRRNQFGKIVDFKDLEDAFYSAIQNSFDKPDEYDPILNISDASDLAKEYIKDRNLPADYVYWDFKGQGVRLDETVDWYFQYLWIREQKTLVAANFPNYTTDRLGPQSRIKNDFWTLITDRREPVTSKIVNMDFFKTYDKTVVKKINKDRNEPIKIPKNPKVYFLFPGCCILLTEFGKEAFHDDKDAIVALGEDKFMSIIRHFISFDNQCLGRVWWDDQNQNAVANVIRSRFGESLYIAKSTTKHSFLFVPFVWIANHRLNHCMKSMAELDKVAPFKHTLGYELTIKKAQFWQHVVDYFSYFDYVAYKIRVLSPDGLDIRDNKNVVKVGLNLRDTYNNYETVVYSDLYKERQAQPDVILWSDLPSYQGLHLTKEEAAQMHSEFVDFMFEDRDEKDKTEKAGKKG